VGFLHNLKITLEMIKWEHSIFALPFALCGAMLAAGGVPAWRQLAWIVVAMVSARSAAMAFNRLADASIDAANPRTATRALPVGSLTSGFVSAFVLIACGVFVLAASQLNRLTLWLSPLALAVVLLYSYSKRFTRWSHLILGFALGIAPAAAWIAVRGSLDPRILLLTAAVTFWVGGFDLIYACQDIDFDRGMGIHSFPQRFGVAAALYGSIICHLAMVALLVGVIRLEHMGWLAMAGLALMATLLAYEHWIVRPADLSRLNAAFFNVNGYISLLFFLTWGADIIRNRVICPSGH
jgi:4-hydroxybenzoate polyprenyltransferase